jgi:hypothetical protein
MTDRRGQSTEDAAPHSLEEAAETIRHDPGLNAGAGPDPATADDAGTDDDARTSDTAQSGDVQGS